MSVELPTPAPISISPFDPDSFEQFNELLRRLGACNRASWAKRHSLRSAREKCREPSDGLTYDKFKAKLLKNKETLVAKYQCRTVRFQVYVKDGKAALKATPVKE